MMAIDPNCLIKCYSCHAFEMFKNYTQYTMLGKAGEMADLIKFWNIIRTDGTYNNLTCPACFAPGCVLPHFAKKIVVDDLGPSDVDTFIEWED